MCIKVILAVKCMISRWWEVILSDTSEVGSTCFPIWAESNTNLVLLPSSRFARSQPKWQKCFLSEISNNWSAEDVITWPIAMALLGNRWIQWCLAPFWRWIPGLSRYRLKVSELFGSLYCHVVIMLILLCCYFSLLWPMQSPTFICPCDGSICSNAPLN